MKTFLFDVDGVLCDDHTPLSPSLEHLIATTRHSTCLVTGGRYDTLARKVGLEIQLKVSKIWTESGAVEDGHPLEDYSSDRPYEIEKVVLEVCRDTSTFAGADWHCTRRESSMNFSPVRSQAARDAYARHDAERLERIAISHKLHGLFPVGWQFMIGGAVSLDVARAGLGKEQIVHRLGRLREVVFFTDRPDSNGNDWALALMVRLGGGRVVHVKGPEQTELEMRRILDE